MSGSVDAHGEARRPPRVLRAFVRYPLFAATVVVGATALAAAVFGNHDFARWVITGYALVVVGFEAWSMVRAFVGGSFGLDVLAIAAILSTLVVGEYWASLLIVLMLTGGTALEDYAGHRARRELRALLERVPQTAHLLGDDGALTSVSVDAVAIGDRIMILPAEVVPVDGTLLSESAAFDESQLTGESLPVEHRAGERVLSGTVNADRAVSIRATSLAKDSQYQDIVRLVSAAAESRAPIVRLADRYAVPFTIVAFGIAGLAWLLSGDPARFAEVLVVATPCPLLIAAPVAFIAGISRAAKSGIIVRSGGTLEQLSRAGTAAFDKTGTLTHGRPQVTRVVPATGRTADAVLSLAASAEQYSNHVLASSLVTAAEERGLPVVPANGVREETARGISAVVEGHEVRVGKPGFVIDDRHDALGASQGAPESGVMSVHVSVDGAHAGHVLLADTVREEAPATLAALAGFGIRTVIMLTGDREATARAVAGELGIADVRAECLPADKVAAIHDAKDRPVMMVGDGVNDAPVLAAADIGVAMGARGSTAASESADVVILVDDLSRVERAVAIGRRTTRIALQSIWFGIAASIGLMIVATFGLIPAIVGAALQEVVDLFSILFALRALGGSANVYHSGSSTVARR